MNLDIFYQLQRMKGLHMFPSPCEEMAQTPKTLPKTYPMVYCIQKSHNHCLKNLKHSSHRTFESFHSKKKKKDLMGPIAESLHADTKKIVGNEGKTNTERGNGQGHPTKC